MKPSDPPVSTDALGVRMSTDQPWKEAKACFVWLQSDWTEVIHTHP